MAVKTLVQDVLDEMKETITYLPVCNPLEDKKILRPPLPTELTIDPPTDESPTNCHTEDVVLPNSDESDESTGEVESIAFMTKNTHVNPDCYTEKHTRQS